MFTRSGFVICRVEACLRPFWARGGGEDTLRPYEPRRATNNGRGNAQGRTQGSPLRSCRQETLPHNEGMHRLTRLDDLAPDRHPPGLADLSPVSQDDIARSVPDARWAVVA